MKKALAVGVVLMHLLIGGGAIGQVDGDNSQFGLAMVNDPEDSLWVSGGDGIRGIIAGSDLDQDGKYEIIATDYDNGGRVYVFEVVADNSIELVWSSPGTGANSSNTCRFVQTGDLDGDGKGEIILAISEETWNQNGEAGLHVFQWDGVTDNGYGDSPVSKTGVIDDLNRFRSEHFLVNDIDGDGKQEVLLAINGTQTHDFFLILSVAGSFDLGTAVWVEEARYTKGIDFDGDAMNVLVADMDGDGKKEAIFQAWNNMTAFVVEAQGSDSYIAGAPYSFGLGSVNDVNLLNGAVADFDGDGKDEIYYNSYKQGHLYVIIGGYESTQLDSSKVFLLSNGGVGPGYASFGMAVGDQDHGPGTDGGDLYIGRGGTADLYDVEYTGGDVTDSLNYTVHIIYSDTTDGSGFVSRVAAPPMDLDGDGNKEIVLGYQNLPDYVNGQPLVKKWLRVLEFGSSTALPVELVTFQFGGSKLVWSTASEKNNLGFEIQRCSTGLSDDFQAVGFVKGQGTKASPTSYFFIDSQVHSGTYYYRLKQIDTNGQFHYSWNVEAEYHQAERYQLHENYPNPFNSSTVITFGLAQDDVVSYVIYDINGREVCRLATQKYFSPGTHQISWNGRNNRGEQLPSGTYFGQLRTSHFVQSHKLLLVK